MSGVNTAGGNCAGPSPGRQAADTDQLAHGLAAGGKGAREPRARPAAPTWAAGSPARSASGRVSSQGGKRKAEAQQAVPGPGQSAAGLRQARAPTAPPRAGLPAAAQQPQRSGQHRGGSASRQGAGVALTFLPRRRPAGGRPSAACLTAATRISMSTLSCWLVSAAGTRRRGQVSPRRPSRGHGSFWTDALLRGLAGPGPGSEHVRSGRLLGTAGPDPAHALSGVQNQGQPFPQSVHTALGRVLTATPEPPPAAGGGPPGTIPYPGTRV